MADDLLRFFDANKGVPRHKSRVTVKRDALDDGVLQDMTAKAELFSKELDAKPTIEIDGKQEEIESWSDFMGDTFRSLHTVEDPGVLELDDILPSQEPIRRTMQRFIGTDEFRAMKPDTTHDEIASAFGAMRAAPKLRELATGELAGMNEQAKKAEKIETRLERQEQKLDDLQEQAKQMHEDGLPIDQDLQDQIDKTEERKENARHDLSKIQKAMNDTPINVGAANVIKEAAKDAKEGVEVVRSLPGMGKGQTKQLNADEALRLAALFAENPKLFEIAKMVGRIVRDMRFKRARRMTGGVEEVVDVKLGNDIPHVLPSQLMYMRHPLLKRWFLRRYIQSALLQRERRGTTEAGRGPLVAVVDESYSMSGQRNVWSKALCMAIMAIARKEKRDAAIVSYSSTGNLEDWSFPWREPMDPSKVVEMAGHFFGGGTDITSGLRRAKEIVQKDERFSRADIVLITDGEDYWREDSDDARMRDELRERAVRVHGIQVGGAPSEYLENACDTLATAMDLTGSNQATDMLAANIN